MTLKRTLNDVKVKNDGCTTVQYRQKLERESKFNRGGNITYINHQFVGYEDDVAVVANKTT